MAGSLDGRADEKDNGGYDHGPFATESVGEVKARSGTKKGPRVENRYDVAFQC